MESITSLGHPLVYKTSTNETKTRSLSNESVTIRTAVRVLQGMQKEAVIFCQPAGTIWRMVSDEGPYLNGTDLAPFPLAFYTAGMALSFTEEFLRHARTHQITIESYKLTQDNKYTMQGSALRGDMIGGALPVAMTVELAAAASPEVIQNIASLATKTSPAQVFMTEVLANSFSLYHNGVATAVGKVRPSPNKSVVNPAPHFAEATPLPDSAYAQDIITKKEAAATLFGVEGGAGSSLQASQKRTLHVRGICTLGDNGLKEVTVQLFKPIGSTFRFLGDDSEQERAPSSLAYLSAGVGFCFMTQIGRYAYITKQKLQAYSIVQDTRFNIFAESAVAEPVDTHVFLETNTTDEVARQIVDMSERTCFLHAAMRSSNKTAITIQINRHTFSDQIGA